MDEKEKEQALEDLKVIKRMMEATNRVAANNGLVFVLFGAYLVISTFLYFLIQKLKEIVNPKILVASFLLWVLLAIVYLSLFLKATRQHQTDWTKISPRITKQFKEIILVILILGFTVPVLALKVAPNDMIEFIQLLIMGIGFYFIGIFLASEFRITGLFLLLGVFLITFYKGSEIDIFGLTFGIGLIFTGIFFRRRWLKQKEEEKNKSGI